MCPEKTNVNNKPGSLDTSFGTQGKLLLEIPGFLEVEVKGLCLDETNDKIYVAATVRDASALLYYALIRLNPDGSFDTEFADTGFVTGQFRDGVDSRGASVTLLESGRLLLSGSIGQVSCLACYDSTGQLKKEFGTGGKVVLDVLFPPHSPTASDEASNSGMDRGAFSKARLLPDGKILTTSIHRFDNVRVVGLLIRLNSDGSLDTSFNKTGYLIVSHPLYLDTYTTLMSVTVQPDGKYLCFGSVWDYGERKALLLRCDANGNMDPSIGPDGFRLISTEHPSSSSLSGYKLAEQSDGRMLIIARTYIPDSGVLTSLTENGLPDSRFNDGKQVITQLESRGLGWNTGAIQDDGNIIVTGYRRSETLDYDLVLARFLETGQLDRSFNGKGWVTNGEPGKADEGSALARQKDGKIIVAGHSGAAIQKSGLILRYLG